MAMATGMKSLKRKLWLLIILHSGQNTYVRNLIQNKNVEFFVQGMCRHAKVAAVGRRIDISEEPF